MLYSETFQSNPVSLRGRPIAGGMPKVEIHIHLWAPPARRVYEMARRIAIHCRFVADSWQRSTSSATSCFLRPLPTAVRVCEAAGFRANGGRIFCACRRPERRSYSEVSRSAAFHLGKLPAEELLDRWLWRRQGYQKYAAGPPHPRSFA